MTIIYKILMINGDYALAESKNGTTNIALALLPSDIAEGDMILFKDCEYSHYRG